MDDWQKDKNILENEPKENTESKGHSQTIEDYQTHYYILIHWRSVVLYIIFLKNTQQEGKGW